MTIRLGLTVAVILLWSPATGGAQDVRVRLVGDSVAVRFVDAELRVVVQALAHYLDRPVVIGAMPSSRVTLDISTPVPRSDVVSLLRGLLETQRLRLLDGEDGKFYRVDADSDAATTRTEAVNFTSPPTEPIRLHSLRLRHARAADVAATVNALYGRASAIGELGARRSPLSDQLQATRAATLQGAGPGASVSSTLRSSATISGELVIVPDAGSNMLLIRSSDVDFQVIREAVDALDVRPLQVLIEVLIAEVRKDRGFSFGVAAELPATRIPGGGDATASGSTSGISLGDFVLNVMNIGGADLDATLRAAASRGDVAIVSRPIVLAANNELAHVLVGSQRPFVQVSRSLPTDAPQRDQVIQYKDVGTQLQVRPTISADGFVMLEVTQEVNAVTTETAFDAPVISTRSIQTRLLVRNGQTAVLGGLADQQRDATQGGVPILSAIPLIGGLFGRVTRRATETELFVFLTPTVIYADEDVDRVTAPLQKRSGSKP